MNPESFVHWLVSKGYVLGASSCGHTGRHDAWTKTLPGGHPQVTVRYYVDTRTVRKEKSLGFGTFALQWVAPYDRLSITEEGKLRRA